MSRQIQIRRGSATEHATFTGAVGEVTMDTTNKTLRVHDGVTPGGTILAKQSEIPSVNTFNLPDTSDKANIGSYATYTFPSDGWLMITANVAGSVQYVSDKYTADTYSPFHYGCLCPNGSAFTGMYPVAAGETVTRTYAAGNWRAIYMPVK